MKLLFLGYGRIARKHRAALAGRAELGVACADPARGSRLVEDKTFAFSAPSYSAGIADPSVEAVFVAVPPDRHYALAREALEAGKHVVLEKPATSTADELAGLDALAAQKRRRLFVAENHSFMPFHRKLRRLLAEGLIGRIEAVRLVRTGRVAPDRSWRFDPAYGPGALYEGGAHWVRRMSELAAPDPAGEAALGGRVLASAREGSDGPVELASTSLVRFDNGVLGVLAHDWTHAKAPLGFDFSTVQGSEGTLKFLGNGLLGIVTGRRTRLIGPELRDPLGLGAMWSAILADLGGGERYPLANARIVADLHLIEECYRLQRAAE